MSGECSFFNFCLRGRDSLVSKWISQKRKIPETLKTDGANIYAISEYIHTVFYFDKLYGSDYSCNVLFNKIIAINELDKNHIVKFDEIIKIPFDFTPCEFTERSFDDMAKDVSGAEFSAVTLGSVLSDSEIKELLINIYHINYDLRENENIKNKTYDEIISGRFIEFKDKASLSFFIPYIFEISAQKVAESSKATVEVSLATSSIQPELSNATVEGYFYKRTTGEADEKNKKYKGASKKAYAVNEFKEKYYESDVIDLNINNDDLNIFANSTAKESSGNKKESYAIASTIVNLATYRNKTILNTLKTEGIYGYNDGGNSTSYKNNAKSSMEAAINALTNGKDYSHGAIRWDGFDLAAKGFNHVKAVDCGIRISETFFNSFKSAWSDDLVNRYSGGKYTKFSDNFKAGDHKATGRYKGCICYEASAVEGLTIFWKKTDDPSFTGGYY